MYKLLAGILFILCIIILTIIFIRMRHTHKHVVKFNKFIESYLQAVYPQSNIDNLTNSDIENLYNSLKWYYLPLPSSIEERRRGPPKGPYFDTETQWFMADGADCGDQSEPGEFTCSVFGGSCKTWEFGNGYDGGRPYQYIAFIEPYNNRDGTPNYSYIECVAFVCEELGRMLLSSNCDKTAPTWQTFLNDPNAGKSKDWAKIEHYCSSKTDCDNNSPGCKISSDSMTDICCWDYQTDKPDNSVCPWPSTCLATKDNGKVWNNYCGVPCGYTGCDVTKNCYWSVEDQKWSDWLKKQSYNKEIIDKLQFSHPKNSTPISPRHDINLSKTMFYWCKGYGKFLNMGKTGVYFNYFHFLLTCPKYAVNKDENGNPIPIRWSFPQILQTATMDGGNSELAQQYDDLMNGRYYDGREYLEGFVTTLRGKQYEGYGENVLQITGAKLLFDTENVNGMYNPADDDNLKEVDRLTVTKYYPPHDKIPNPQYRKTIQFTPYEACYLLQGMHIYGATANSTQFPFVTMSGRYPSSYGTGVYPFGVHFAGSNLGHCVYQLTKLCGWNSSQFTQMPTGAGGRKYCNYPEYDYEIVYIHDKDWVCKSGFKLLDPTKDLNNYILYGFVKGSNNPDKDTKKYNITQFTPDKFKLTERNVPDDWLGPHPNATQYKLPSQPVKDTTKCPYEDEVYNKN